MRLRFSVAALFAGIAVLAPVTAAQAQNYPTKPITMIVPFAPGGGTDVVARALGPVLGAKLGQTIIVENVSGGGGNIGSTRVARAAPDGYTIVMHNVAFALNVSLFRQLPFDAQKDFVPISFLNKTPLVHVGRKSLPANTLPELVDWMKKNPAKFANPGVGSTGHLAATLFAHAAKVNADLIPYRGGGPALQDVIAGHVDLTPVTLQNAIEPVKSGLVKGFAITSAERAKELPDVPSVTEIDPNAVVLFWNMILAPAGTPKPVVDKLHAALEEALADPQLIASWEKAGIQVYPKAQRTPDAAKTMLRDEIERWSKVIRENKIEVAQ